MSNNKGTLSKSTKICIGIIIALVAVIIGFVVYFFTNKNDKEKEPTTQTTQAVEVASQTDAEDLTTEEEPEKESVCSLSISNSNSWQTQDGYAGQLDVTITNNENKEYKNWKIEIDASKVSKVDSSWNGNVELKDGVITITAVEYNEAIPANGKVGDIGFIVAVSASKDLQELTENARLYIDDTLVSEMEASKTTKQEDAEEKDEPKKDSTTKESGTPYANHGKLSISGSDLVDENGDKYQLQGLSTHGIAWFPDYVNKDAFQTFRDDWDANVIRLAMYTDENNGYCNGGDKGYIKGLVEDGVDYATELGMYVIVDWHILSDNSPEIHKADALVFFDEMSKKYKDNGNVIYEICNEPNSGTSWDTIKSYADEVIPVIRANAPDAIIIVGTPTWCQDLDVVAGSPLKGYDNIMYAAHFYASTHKDNIRDKVETAIDSGLPVIISEYSICDASGNGAIDYGQADEWFDFIEKHNLSYVAWNISNKNETSSLISSSCTLTSGWSESDLSETGKWIRGKMKENQ